LLIISNVGSTYFENFKMSNFSFFLFHFSKMKISWGFFSKKSFIANHRAFSFGIFIKCLFILGFNLSPNLGCKTKNKIQ
jgi:hypothetical protein